MNRVNEHAARSATNVDEHEIAHFDNLSAEWWDSDGELRTLHHLNPARLDYIHGRTGPLRNKTTVDVGCGGGILAEALATAGAAVTGIDLSTSALTAARLHARETGVHVQYVEASAEHFARTHTGAFALVTCLELLEHVPDPASTIAACANLAAPGADIVFSTISRTFKAYLGAVVGAEYVLGLLPRGTHDYQRFIRPSELAAEGRRCALELLDVTGLAYNPFTGKAWLSSDPHINYLAHFRRLPD
ncbi:MAG: bifunctional 2-polyprenyl-6-hydroxyphenol methylase/3-demethylubiquinol 3-O-methyltransferase UbiG [Gammaproteobacteria bacterium]|nr:bifunctional 2-polyprenyl-6-hydroxyphenol methylase/3-demethylubiquinol 3-O-methyltransferase UbiG [Gammaproteobacteria bacterium]